MKNISLLFVLLICPVILPAQPQIRVVELSVKRPDINWQNEETILTLSIRDLENHFLSVKSFNYRLEDDQGVDLVARGASNLKELEKKGFYTTVSPDWEFFDYKFYNQMNAFGAKITSYSAPSQDSKKIVLKGELVVLQKTRNNQAQEATIENISIHPDSVYSFNGGRLTFTENGAMRMGNSNYKIYKVNSETLIAGVAVVGQQKLDDVFVDSDELYVLDTGSDKPVSLVFTIPDSEQVRIPIDLAIGVGLN